jgi:hypothetical protein
MAEGDGEMRVTRQYIEVLAVQTEYVEQVAQSLGLSDSLNVVAPIRIEVQQNLGLQEVADGRVGVYHRDVGDVLDFQERMGRVLERTVSQSLTLIDTVERKHPVAQSLGLVQTVTHGKGATSSDNLNLQSIADYDAILNRSVSDALGLHQSVTYYLGGDCITKQYTPFIGSSTDTEFTPPDLTPPTLSDATLTLTYPYVSPTNTLVLRNPSFGNRDRLAFNRINRETRGGTLVVFADPIWPKSQTLQLTVDVLSDAQVENLLTFLAQSLGKEIGLLDHEGRQWRGIITTPDTSIAHAAMQDRTVTFDFEGELA